MHPASTASSAQARRRSHHIKRKSASSIHHAPALAEALGQPLTHFVTINFTEAGLTPDAASDAFARLRNSKFGHWARRPPRGSGFPSSRPTYAWVIETAGGVVSVHWLLHLPRGREADFEKRLPKWVAALSRSSLEQASASINIKVAYNPRGARKYMLKGIQPAYARFYGIRPVDQGAVDGKRSGVSQNLGPSIRARLKEAGVYRPGRWRRPERQAPLAPVARSIHEQEAATLQSHSRS